MENTENKAVVEEVVEQTTDQTTDEVKKDDAPKPKKPKKLVKENSDDVDFKIDLRKKTEDAIQEQKFESGEIIISAKQEDNEIKIIIADNGLGIPEDIQTKIFDPSFTTKQVGKRTGQGLALAHNLIAKKHAGSLHFETKQGTGTKFIVTIPNHQSE